MLSAEQLVASGEGMADADKIEAFSIRDAPVNYYRPRWIERRLFITLRPMSPVQL